MVPNILLIFVIFRNSEFSPLLSHEKWTEYFSKGDSAANHPEFIKLLQFCFYSPTHNANVERIFFLMQGQWIEKGTSCLLTQ
jgi:hypothetical protein